MSQSKVRATRSFSAGRRFVHRGDILPSDDPVVSGREALFEDIATLEPPSPAKKAPAKKANKSADADD